jgi:mercuric ion binding protein
MKKLILALALFGFSFGEEVFVIDVEGMTCKTCPIAVKKAIEKVEGVLWVKTTLKNRIAVVVTKDGVLPQKILEAISKAGGYKGEIIGRSRF